MAHLHALFRRCHAAQSHLLVVMAARNQLDQTFKIHWTIQPPFPLHLVVRTQKNMKWRLAESETFLTEVMSKGKILYEACGAA